MTEIAKLKDENARLRARWVYAKPFVEAVLEVWDEAIGNRQDKFTLNLGPPRIMEKFDRHLVRSMLQSAMEGLGALHDTFSTDEIDQQLRDAGGDPDAIGNRGAELVAQLMADRRQRTS